VPLALTLGDLTYDGICPRMYEKCATLEFSALIKKLHLVPTADTCAEAEKETAVSLAPLPQKRASAEELLAHFPVGSTLAITLDGDGLCLSDGKEAFSVITDLTLLAPLFDGSRRVIAYDGKALLHALWRMGIPAECTPRNLLLYAYVLHSGDGSYAPDALALRYLGAPIPEETSPLCAFFPLEEALLAEIRKIGCEQLLEEIELPLSPVLARMERAGFRIDTEALTAYGEKLFAQTVLFSENIIALAGIEFNKFYNITYAAIGVFRIDFHTVNTAADRSVTPIKINAAVIIGKQCRIEEIFNDFAVFIFRRAQGFERPQRVFGSPDAPGCIAAADGTGYVDIVAAAGNGRRIPQR
jgi:hypothetical protein